VQEPKEGEEKIISVTSIRRKGTRLPCTANDHAADLDEEKDLLESEVMGTKALKVGEDMWRA
jgi:hypothetical protein